MLKQEKCLQLLTKGLQRDWKEMSMVLKQGAVLSLAGISAGIVGAILLGRFMTSMVFGVSPTDPIALLVTALALGTISILACCAPARWACRLDPAEVLRNE